MKRRVMREPKILAKAWQALKCQNGHSLYITTREMIDFLPEDEVDQYPNDDNYFDIANMVAIGHHSDEVSWKCHCGAEAINFNYEREDNGWWLSLLYKDKK